MSQQQTVLRVQTNIPHPTITGRTEYTFLDLYSDIPIKINKSFSELQDIAKKNSDYSIGLSLPGSKKNNQFFESFFNVDSSSLYFNSTKRVECQVLLNDQSYFRGYMRLNKVSVINSKVEYDVTLYSSVGDLFGKIGNNLLKDLDFDDTEYTFNHTFSADTIGNLFANSNFFKNSKYPYTYFYPIVHNGYNYVNVSGATLPDFSGSTVSLWTRLYTPTSPITGSTTVSGLTSLGIEQYRINSPQYGIVDNQLKPALNIYSLIQLMFKSYGYEISSDFFKTPWFKTLYLYGYFSADSTKFGYRLDAIQQLPKEGVELIYSGSTTPGSQLNIIVCKRGTGIPCYCLDDISYGFANMFPFTETGTIFSLTSGTTLTATNGFDFGFEVDGVPVADISTLKYAPAAVGASIAYFDGDSVNFNLVIDQNIKQIDLLSSIAKKFDLVFIPDPDYPNRIKIEPYDFYVGTGTIYDWTPKLSYDKGFTVEPALNYIESTLELTDQEDGDEGNREFKISNNRIYGRNIVYNPTDFKSQDKKIDTIFSPELIRQWDTLGPNSGSLIGLPLGINYAAASEISSYDNQVRWIYKGVKSKPKLMFWGMGLNPFIDSVGEVYPYRVYNTYTVKLQNWSGGTASSYDRIPSISHTIPYGLDDQYKINNDSLSILFNSEQPVQNTVPLYNAYTENDVYNIFYNNRITNLYDPNTRFINGYFDLKYSDIQNLEWNDIIKINEQYFTINKISEFNLTNRELTKVELIQFNVNTKEYPTRYFKYQYCDAPSYCFKLKTDFTNDNLRDTNFIWSIYYDNQVGSLTGQTSGFTSAFRIFNTGSFQEQYVPYTMNEISEYDYNSGSCYNSSSDTMLTYIENNPNGLIYSLKGFWEAGGNVTGSTGVNVWNNCTDFNTTKNTYGIVTGSSTTYGPIFPPTSTPTPTPTATPGGPTPTPTPTPTGSIPTGSLFYYDPGNIASYPGSGSILYDISGNGRHANINTGITWVSGSDAYFSLNGVDNNSITGTTLSQTLTSWSMWMGVYRNGFGSFDGFMAERSGAGNINGLGQYFTGNDLNLLVNNGTQIPITNGTLITGSWLFIAGTVDNTTYNTQVYTSGSINPFVSGSKLAGTSNFNDAIVLGEDKESFENRTLNGRIGPALMYDRKLSTGELIGINDYFKNRYGI